MTGRTAHCMRTRWIMCLIVVLFLAGTTGAAAYWTAQTPVEGTATAATVGLDQDLLPAADDPDASATYSAETLTLSRSVAITTTGNREAAARLDVRPASQSSSGLSSALSVTIAPVANRAQCSPGAASSGASTGSLPLTYDGKLAAGATVVLCVQTSLAPSDVASWGGEQTELTLASTLTYATGDAWTLQGPTETITQHVKQAEKNPFDDAEKMTCSGNDWYIETSFSSLAQQDQKQRVEYRVFLAHERTPDVRVAFTARDISGYYTAVQLPVQSLEPFVRSSEGGLGNTWVYVEQRMAGEQTWSPAAVATINTSSTSAGDVRVRCGWKL